MLTSDREIAIKSFINEWLKDPNPYCHNCGQPPMKDAVCCETPRIATNYQITYETIQDVKDLRKTRANQFAATKSKQLRWTLRLPMYLVADIERYFDECGKKHLDSKEYLEASKNGEFRLFNKEYTQNWFAKKFPQFAVAEKI